MYKKYGEPSSATKELYNKAVKNAIDKMPREAQVFFSEDNLFCGVTTDFVLLPNKQKQDEEDEICVNFVHCVFSNGLYYFKFIDWYEEFVIHLRENFTDPCVVVYPPILWDMVLKTIKRNDINIIWDFLNEYYNRDILGKTVSIIKENDEYFLSVGIAGNYYLSASHFLTMQSEENSYFC